MRWKSILVLIVLLAALEHASSAQDPPFSRFGLSVSPSYIDLIEKVPAASVPGESGSVLVIFRTSEQGGVVDVRSAGGSPELKQSAETAVKQWHGKPMMLASGQPMEMVSAVYFDFANGVASIRVPRPMTAEQLSPKLGLPCWSALAHESPDAVDPCRKQLEAIDQGSAGSAMEVLTARDQFGLALLKKGNMSSQALDQFSQAIEMAPKCLKGSDAEWAYVHWHRAIAELQLGSGALADQDLIIATESLKQAEMATGNPAASYYHGLVNRVEALRAQHLKPDEDTKPKSKAN
jgi:hypothetical protein